MRKTRSVSRTTATMVLLLATACAEESKDGSTPEQIIAKTRR